MKIKRAYKYRFYPDAEQEELLAKTFGCVRFVYNHILRYRTDAYYQAKEKVSYIGANVEIDRFFPSSKRCHCCGYISESMPLDVRSWVCPECKTENDRDINAAKNILAEGLSVLAFGELVNPVCM